MRTRKEWLMAWKANEYDTFEDALFNMERAKGALNELMSTVRTAIDSDCSAYADDILELAFKRAKSALDCMD